MREAAAKASIVAAQGYKLRQQYSAQGTQKRTEKQNEIETLKQTQGALQATLDVANGTRATARGGVAGLLCPAALPAPRCRDWPSWGERGEGLRGVQPRCRSPPCLRVCLSQMCPLPQPGELTMPHRWRVLQPPWPRLKLRKKVPKKRSTRRGMVRHTFHARICMRGCPGRMVPCCSPWHPPSCPTCHTCVRCILRARPRLHQLDLPSRILPPSHSTRLFFLFLRARAPAPGRLPGRGT